MKTLLLLLLPLFSFAQTPYPDSLYLTDGRVFSCFVTGINESSVTFSYAANKSETTILIAVNKISVEQLGVIYKLQGGLLKNENVINDFLKKRYDKVQLDKAINNDLAKLSAAQVYNDIPNTNEAAALTTLTQNNNNYKKFSFGVLLVPYYSGEIYELVLYDSYPPLYYISGFANNEINMEAQFSYSLLRELNITFDVAYSSSHEKDRRENHNSSNGYQNDYGSLVERGLTMLDFTFGVKYSFGNFIAEQVNLYALAGIGKQLAFADYKDEALFQDTPSGVSSTNNEEEFTEEINSPFHFNIGFGAEYFINNSLSLNSNIRFLYSTASGEYNSRYVSTYETRNYNRDYSFSKFITRVGLGLNFYF